MRRALLAIVVLVAGPLSAWGQQQFDRHTLLRVLLATDARQVADCQRLGFASDNSPEDLRKKILRGGGDAGLVTFDLMDPDKINAEVYRCQKPVAPAVTAAAVPGDPTAIHNVLLGTWSGTLSNRSSPTRGLSQLNQASATIRVANEGGQLRWTMESGNPELNGSGTVTHFFGDVTLTGTYGPGGLPITYSLKLGNQTLEGTGAGPDHIVRTLSLRKQP